MQARIRGFVMGTRKSFCVGEKMHLTFRNVNDAFRAIVGLFSRDGLYHSETARAGQHTDAKVIRKPSRNGDVLMIEEPVTITYTHSRERVLFNTARDCNPFFHLMEALWMLAGRNDVAPLAYYCSKIAQYSDDGKTFNGAYGYRWRTAKVDDPEAPPHPRKLAWHGQHGGVDQLDILVQHLKADPNSRRAVLTMWEVESDLLKVGQECGNCGGVKYVPSEEEPCDRCKGSGMERQSKDVCCNLNVMFSLRNCPEKHRRDHPPHRFLDMTITNRSNDAILGLLGANYVHFSVLQEYMAARIGVEVGKYNHFTNNLHIYTWNWEPEKWLAEKYFDGFHVSNPDDWGAWYNGSKTFGGDPKGHPVIPLVKDPAVFEVELPIFVERYSGKPETYSPCAWQEPFFNDVAGPMLTAFRAHKDRWGGGCEMWLEQIKADDWRIAATQWLQKRREKARK